VLVVVGLALSEQAQTSLMLPLKVLAVRGLAPILLGQAQQVQV
jgi:hypothetical protein